MTLTEQIITDAFRQSNLLALSVSPTEAQKEEALRYLNRIVRSVFGNEAGESLTAFAIGDKNISRPRGYPFLGLENDQDWFVPTNTRVMLSLTEPCKLYLTPAPDDGARFGVSDAARNLATYPVTLHGNGAYIEGSASIVLDTNGFEGEWFYRRDLASWMKTSPLDYDTEFPFPSEFDDFFITMLALRLNPSYGASLDPQSGEILSRSRSQLRSRYTQHIPEHSEIALTRMSRMSVNRDQWNDFYSNYDPNLTFNRGRPW